MKRMNVIGTMLCILTLIFAGTLCFAQTGFHRINAGAEIGLPVGDFGNAYGIGFGATGKAFYNINDKVDITGKLGYLHFAMKDDHDMMSGSMGMIPIMFGYRYNFGGFYGEPQLGFTNLRSKVKFNDSGLGGMLSSLSGNSSTTKVSFALGGGYSFEDWDLGAHFQIVDQLNFFGLRVGYNFSFK